jgi:transcription initiation factor TFIIB
MNRVGGAENSLLGSHNLLTTIGPSPKGGVSYSNNYASSYTSSNHIRTNVEKTLLSGFGSITNMCDRINLPDNIKQRSQELFKTVHEGRSLKGRANEAIASACLYIACRQEGVPRTFKEIVAISTINKKEIGRCFKLILNAHQTEVEIITTGDFMHRFCATLGLSKNAQKAATYVAKQAVDLDIVPGRSPISVAATAIYMASHASNDKRSQGDIAETAGVAAVTIKQVYKLMLPRAAELFPVDFEFSIPIDRFPSS